MNVNMFDAPGGRGEPGAMLRARGVASSSRAAATWPADGWARAGWPRSPEIVAAGAGGCCARRATSQGERVLVTAGPTVEDIDPVRFVSNRSSGRMGYRWPRPRAIAAPRVVLVSGPTGLAAARRRRARAGALGRGDAARRPRAAAAGERRGRRRGRDRLSARGGRRLEAEEGARAGHARAGPDARHPGGRRGREGRARRRRFRGGDRGPAGERAARSCRPRISI